MVGTPAYGNSSGKIDVLDSSMTLLFTFYGSSNENLGAGTCISLAGGYVAFGSPHYSTNQGRIGVINTTAGTVNYYNGAGGDNLGEHR